ncbi:MAG: hypothetical protein L6290_09080 [Thermodesulfovibrionales bacterium]|nr:hypothetical protein [Thermodesulfovibrionales bacterium]
MTLRDLENTVDVLLVFGKARQIDAWCEERGKDQVAVKAVKELIKPAPYSMSYEEQGRIARRFRNTLDIIMAFFNIEKKI